MSEMYAEAFVKRNKNLKSTLGKVAVILVDIILFIAGLLGSSVALFFCVIGVVATVYFISYFNVDYEYVFCDGQFDFDKILGGNKRKNQLRIDLENCELLCPENSHRLDGYTYQKLTYRDFSSGDMTAKRYALVGKDSKNHTMVKVIFEPSEKMLAFAKQKAPRKVFTD